MERSGGSVSVSAYQAGRLEGKVGRKKKKTHVDWDTGLLDGNSYAIAEGPRLRAQVH
jgi:hypothetical protein